MIISLAAGLLASVPANAQSEGVCTIRPSDLLATFGFSASGTILASNALNATAGPFAQVGAATGLTATQKANIISGKWTVTITQNDSTGKVSTNTFPGTYTVDTNTCTGDFSWNALNAVVFRAVFVKDAKQFNSVSVLPGVIIAYNGKKL